MDGGGMREQQREQGSEAALSYLLETLNEDGEWEMSLEHAAAQTTLQSSIGSYPGALLRAIKDCARAGANTLEALREAYLNVPGVSNPITRIEAYLYAATSDFAEFAVNLEDRVVDITPIADLKGYLLKQGLVDADRGCLDMLQVQSVPAIGISTSVAEGVPTKESHDSIDTVRGLIDFSMSHRELRHAFGIAPTSPRAAYPISCLALYSNEERRQVGQYRFGPLDGVNKIRYSKGADELTMSRVRGFQGMLGDPTIAEAMRRYAYAVNHEWSHDVLEGLWRVLEVLAGPGKLIDQRVSELICEGNGTRELLEAGLREMRWKRNGLAHEYRFEQISEDDENFVRQIVAEAILARAHLIAAGQL